MSTRAGRPPCGRPVWFHGDIATGNLLVADGALKAVMDFGTSGVSDPACDLVIAWGMLSGGSREAFCCSTPLPDRAVHHTARSGAAACGGVASGERFWILDTSTESSFDGVAVGTGRL